MELPSLHRTIRLCKSQSTPTSITSNEHRLHRKELYPAHEDQQFPPPPFVVPVNTIIKSSFLRLSGSFDEDNNLILNRRQSLPTNNNSIIIPSPSSTESDSDSSIIITNNTQDNRITSVGDESQRLFLTLRSNGSSKLSMRRYYSSAHPLDEHSAPPLKKTLSAPTTVSTNSGQAFHPNMPFKKGTFAPELEKVDYDDDNSSSSSSSEDDLFRENLANDRNSPQSTTNPVARLSHFPEKEEPATFFQLQPPVPSLEDNQILMTNTLQNPIELAKTVSAPPMYTLQSFQSEDDDSDVEETNFGTRLDLKFSSNKRKVCNNLRIRSLSLSLKTGAMDEELGLIEIPPSLSKHACPGDPQNKTSCKPRNSKSLLAGINSTTIIYLSTFAIFGSIVRVYLSRLFGVDCEFGSVDDIFSQLHLCVTSTGKTTQKGGALFADLPANILGSTVMGFLTTVDPSLLGRWSDPSILVGFKTGLCGCLTTFASWNAQMVIMLNGTDLELGSQIAPALFGYLIGMQCSVASFVFGRHFASWLNRWRSRSASRNEVEEKDLEEQRNNDAGYDGSNTDRKRIETKDFSSHRIRGRHCNNNSSRWYFVLTNPNYFPFFLLSVFFVLFLLEDAVWESKFHRKMWLSVLLTPPGALCRWQLSALNNSKQLRCCNTIEWLPWGTFIANVMASVIAVAAIAIEIHLLNKAKTDEASIWAICILAALKTGFAGSLSTVSTFVKEFVELVEQRPQHLDGYIYACGTLACCCLVGLGVYSAII